MKKILFVLAFAFIGQQAFSQMYMIHIGSYTISSCNANYEYTLTKVDPTGNATHTCICKYIDQSSAMAYCSSSTSSIITLNQEFNRVLKKNGQVYIFGKQPMLANLYNQIKDLFEFRFELVWNKGKGFWTSNFMPMKSHELIWCFKKKVK